MHRAAGLGTEGYVYSALKATRRHSGPESA